MPTDLPTKRRSAGMGYLVTPISRMGGFYFLVFLNPWALILKFWMVFCFGSHFLFKSIFAMCVPLPPIYLINDPLSMFSLFALIFWLVSLFKNYALIKCRPPILRDSDKPFVHRPNQLFVVRLRSPSFFLSLWPQLHWHYCILLIFSCLQSS